RTRPYVVAVSSESSRGLLGHSRGVSSRVYVQLRDFAVVFRFGDFALGRRATTTLAHPASYRCLCLCRLGLFRRRQPPALYLVVGSRLTPAVVVGGTLDLRSQCQAHAAVHLRYRPASAG